jgi:hypothetical protein
MSLKLDLLKFWITFVDTLEFVPYLFSSATTINLLAMVGANVARITCMDFELQLIIFFSFGSVGALFGIT